MKHLCILWCIGWEQKVTCFLMIISVFFVVATFMEHMDCEVAIQKTSPDLKWAQISPNETSCLCTETRPAVCTYYQPSYCHYVEPTSSHKVKDAWSKCTWVCSTLRLQAAASVLLKPIISVLWPVRGSVRLRNGPFWTQFDHTWFVTTS